MSSPIVRKGKIIGFFDGWIGSRLFPVDMAGFAVTVQTLLAVSRQRGTPVRQINYNVGPQTL